MPLINPFHEVRDNFSSWKVFPLIHFNMTKIYFVFQLPFLLLNVFSPEGKKTQLYNWIYFFSNF